jgi:hypothetical protein
MSNGAWQFSSWYQAGSPPVGVLFLGNRTPTGGNVTPLKLETSESTIEDLVFPRHLVDHPAILDSNDSGYALGQFARK